MATGFLTRDLGRRVFFVQSRNRGMTTGFLPRDLVRKKYAHTFVRFAVVWSVFWCFCQYLFLIRNPAIVGLPPRFHGPRD